MNRSAARRKPGGEAGRLLRDDRGSTTVVGAAITAMVLVLTMVAIQAGAGLVEQRRTSVAADLAAVAGAVDAQRGGAGCDAAAGVAAANGGHVAHCTRDGEDVQVTVVRGERSATARAGPAE